MSEPTSTPTETPPALEKGGVWRGADGRIRAIWRCLLFSALTLGPLLLLSGGGEESKQLPREVSELSAMFAAYMLINGILLLLSWGFLHWFDRRSFCSLGFWFYRGWSRETVLGIGIGTGLIGVVVAILHASGAVKYTGVGLGQGEAPRFLLITIILIVAAAFEEFLTRGYAFQRLVEAAGAPAAILVFSVVFGVGHLSNPGATILSTLCTILAGVLLSLAYLKTKALWLPIGLHWAWNFTMGPVLGLPVSGLQVIPTLLRAEIGGAAWFSGGSYGPEGGMVVALVVGLVAVWLARTAKIRPSPKMTRALE